MKCVLITRQSPTQQKNDVDFIALEQAINIDLVYGPAYCRNQTRLAMTMRTPGHDRELAMGLLFSQGLIESEQNILDIVPCRRNILDPKAIDQLTIFLDDKMIFSPQGKFIGHPRYSSCGICGSDSLIPPNNASTSMEDDFFVMRAKTLYAFPQKMKEHQTIFQKTGGTHAAALFDENGLLQAIFEDVGRHNALDKLIGHMLMKKSLPIKRSILLLSSRASYEIIEKALRAGVKIVAVMGAVSSLAVELADSYAITLIGFLRAERFNVYSHHKRID